MREIDMENEDQRIDPEFLDAIIQSISVLSNVATLASTWLILRSRQPNPLTATEKSGPVDLIRTNLRTLRRGLEDSFSELQAALEILEEARASSKSSELLNAAPRFGNGVMLATGEMQRLNQVLQRLEAAAMHARTAARNINLLLSSQPSIGHAIDAKFDPESFNAELNSILFDSKDFREQMGRLRVAQQTAEDFIAELEAALRRNAS